MIFLKFTPKIVNQIQLVLSYYCRVLRFKLPAYYVTNIIEVLVLLLNISTNL